jgi:hypothetical protein
MKKRSKKNAEDIMTTEKSIRFFQEFPPLKVSLTHFEFYMVQDYFLKNKNFGNSNQIDLDSQTTSYLVDFARHYEFYKSYLL